MFWLLEKYCGGKKNKQQTPLEWKKIIIILLTIVVIGPLIFVVMIFFSVELSGNFYLHAYRNFIISFNIIIGFVFVIFAIRFILKNLR